MLTYFLILSRSVRKANCLELRKPWTISHWMLMKWRSVIQLLGWTESRSKSSSDSHFMRIKIKTILFSICLIRFHFHIMTLHISLDLHVHCAVTPWIPDFSPKMHSIPARTLASLNYTITFQYFLQTNPHNRPIRKFESKPYFSTQKTWLSSFNRSSDRKKNQPIPE